jgi:hypothetical protein
MCDYRWGFGLVNGFFDHLQTQLGITSNYSAIANLQNSQITTAPAKLFPVYVFIRRSLVTSPNSGNSSSSIFTACRAELKVKVTLRLTGSQSVSLGVEPDIYYCLTVTVLFCGAPSLTKKRVCLLYMLLALASAVFLRSESLGTRDHILLSQN